MDLFHHTLALVHLDETYTLGKCLDPSEHTWLHGETLLIGKKHRITASKSHCNESMREGVCEYSK